MPNAAALDRWIDSALPQENLYGDRAPRQPARYHRVLSAFVSRYGDGPLSLFSVPGRTEISGNHTDHNHGCVLAGAVNLDVIACAAPNGTSVIRLQSEGHGENLVDLSCLTPQAHERGRSNALIRGICARFHELGLPIGGFDAYTTSDVMAGSGLSSSAAFEVLVCTMLDHLFGDGALPPLQRAQIARYAENVYFGKPCGLMDQTACAYGGLVAIDFFDDPRVESVPFDFTATGYGLCIVNTGGSHADLTEAYAAIPSDMGAVAAALGATHLRYVDETLFFARLPELRTHMSDRALLRALHFFTENARVGKQVEALRRGDFGAFLRLTAQSGHSSLQNNQNVMLPGTAQPLALALALSEYLLAGRGAARVHGGGFAGTMQAFVPADLLPDYRARMDAVFGESACAALTIRPVGAVKLV